MIKDFVLLVSLLTVAASVTLGLSWLFDLDSFSTVAVYAFLLFATALVSEALNWLKFNKIVVKTERYDPF
jgi:hypothetical protein